ANENSTPVRTGSYNALQGTEENLFQSWQVHAARNADRYRPHSPDSSASRFFRPPGGRRHAVRRPARTASPQRRSRFSPQKFPACCGPAVSPSPDPHGALFIMSDTGRIKSVSQPCSITVLDRAPDTGNPVASVPPVV